MYKWVYVHSIYPYDADGARRRCRAAHGSAGGRRTGGHGHGTKGYSKATRTRVLKKGTQKGYSNRGAQKEVLKSDAQKGYSIRVLNKGTQKAMLEKSTQTYSNRGTQTRVLKKRCSTRRAQKGVFKNGVLKRGTQKGVLERGYSLRVLKKGYSTEQ